MAHGNTRPGISSRHLIVSVGLLPDHMLQQWALSSRLLLRQLNRSDSHGIITMRIYTFHNRLILGWLLFVLF